MACNLAGAKGRVRTTCPYCGVGCGLLADVDAAGAVSVRGDPDHPANFGRLCSKGAALAETLSLDGRLLHPMIGGYVASWENALDLVANRFRQAIDDYGPNSVAFYVSGQILTECYYVANKLMKGYIGSANIDTNSRLCMASSVAGHKRAFGADTVPGTYEDLELADLAVLTGSNLAWCHPVLYQRLAAAKEKRGTKVVVIDPRVTATCEIADLHLPLAPESDVALFNGLLAHLNQHGARNSAFVDKHTSGIAQALSAAERPGVDSVVEATGLPETKIIAFYDLFAATERVVTVYSQGVNQSTSGTDKVNAIINCHLLTGRIGRPGMGPFSVTGQPNAMGGREVGGLANQLACHMELENEDHRALVQRFWNAPRIATKPGLKAVDLFRACADGRIKALWIMGTNPVDSLPEADAVRAALETCPFVAVSDVVRHTDTTAVTDVLLPSSAWGEKDGTVTNSERRISRQRPFLASPGEAKPDWWQFTQIARRMGFAYAFPYENPAEIFAEHAELSGYENSGSRDFDIAAHAGISQTSYDRLEPFQWPWPKGRKPGETRFFADGEFFTSDRRARFVPTPYCALASQCPGTFPFILNTGRIRDQWHTMTRTAKSSRLMQHLAEPFVEIHPRDAERIGLETAELAIVRNELGSILVRTLINDRQRPGSIFIPIHWTDQLASSARVGTLVAGRTDPISGQPEFKRTPVTIERFEAAWYGFAITSSKPKPPDVDYWALAPAKCGWRIELAGRAIPDDWNEFAQQIFPLHGHLSTDSLAYHDATTGQHRYAYFKGDLLCGALFVARRPVAVSRSWMAEQLAETWPDPSARLRLLSGHAGKRGQDRGAIVCACFEVGSNQIRSAACGGCITVDQIGAALGAGTNCGSCRSEISRIIDESCIQVAS